VLPTSFSRIPKTDNRTSLQVWMQTYCTFVLFVNQHFQGLPASVTHNISVPLNFQSNGWISLSDLKVFTQIHLLSRSQIVGLYLHSPIRHVLLSNCLHKGTGIYLCHMLNKDVAIYASENAPASVGWLSRYRTKLQAARWRIQVSVPSRSNILFRSSYCSPSLVRNGN
jgi:hypothetical protein